MTGLVLFAAGAVLIWLGFGLWRIGAVSRGTEIGARAGGALVLVDLQEVFWERGPYGPAEKAAAEAVILEEVKAARAKGWVVIALTQEWSIPATKVIARLAMKGQALAGSDGVALAGPFRNLADHVLVKRVQDGFETGEMDPLLERLGVGQIRIMGLDFNHCVLKTALAARNRGYEVQLVTGGTLAAADRARAEARLAARGVVLV